MRQYQGAEVESDGGVEEGEHAEEVEAAAQAVDVAAQDLLPVAPRHLAFEHCDLVEPHVAPLAHLHSFQDKGARGGCARGARDG